MPTIDVFTHVLPRAYERALERSQANLGARHPSVRENLLTDMDMRLVANPPRSLQIVGSVIFDEQIREKYRAEVAQAANRELSQLVLDHPELFEGAIAHLPLNDLEFSCHYLADTIARSDTLVGIQMLTHEDGRNFADEQNSALFSMLNEVRRPVWLHPVAEHSSPHFLESAKQQLLATVRDLMDLRWAASYPRVRVILHGGVAALFAQGEVSAEATRLTAQQNFVVDTAWANSLEITTAVKTLGAGRVLFSSDSPFATETGVESLDVAQHALEQVKSAQIDEQEKQLVLSGSWEHMRARIPVNVLSEQDLYEEEKAQAEAEKAKKEAEEDEKLQAEIDAEQKKKNADRDDSHGLSASF